MLAPMRSDALQLVGSLTGTRPYADYKTLTVLRAARRVLLGDTHTFFEGPDYVSSDCTKYAGIRSGCILPSWPPGFRHAATDSS